MSEVEVFHKQLFFETKGNKTTYFEIRKECIDFIEELNVKDGILVIQSPHTTCSVLFEEMVHDRDALGDEYLQYDLNKGLNKIFPKQLEYDDYYKYPGIKHREWGKSRPNNDLSKNSAILLNADSHLKSSVVGSDITLIIKDGMLSCGTYGYIYFVDFDGHRPRKRKCNLCCIKFE